MNFFEFQKKLRQKLMPTGEELSKITQDKCNIDLKKLKTNFGLYLKHLLDLEFKLYKEYERKCSKEIIEQAIKKSFLKDYKNLSESIHNNYQQLWDFFLSISQSRKTRAGGSFERHVRYLFELLDYPFDKQSVLNGKVDYVIPSKEAFFKNRTACVVISIKRTLRERWRQVVGELASINAGKIYILTADENIPAQKVNEIKKHNINLVVWDEIKNKRFKTNYYVLGFTQFIKEDLPSSKKLWSKLVNDSNS